ncbi:MAG: hypothetical protein ACK5LN_10415 [Propioniciclava sp.]
MLADRTGVRYQPGFTALRKVLQRRAPGGDLKRCLSDADVDRVIASSGGQFRDLLRLVRLALLETRGFPVTQEALRKAEVSVRDDYAQALTAEQLKLLRDIHHTKEAFVPKDQGADEAALVTLGAILRYPNDDHTWYDVHPLLRPLLD